MTSNAPDAEAPGQAQAGSFNWLVPMVNLPLYEQETP